MAGYILGIFVVSADAEIIRTAQTLWPFTQIKNMAPHFEGWAILGHDTVHTHEIDLEIREADNLRLQHELPAFSLKFPNETFVLLEEDEHGDLSSYRGLACRNGEIVLDAMGNFGDALNQFAEAFENGTLDWFKFYDQRLNALIRLLGVGPNPDGYVDWLDADLRDA